METINIYRCNGEWSYARFADGEFDHSDALGVEDDASYSDAAAEAVSMFPGAEVRRVEDVAV
jgi:hypothetical protein